MDGDAVEDIEHWCGWLVTQGRMLTTAGETATAATVPMSPQAGAGAGSAGLSLSLTGARIDGNSCAGGQSCRRSCGQGGGRVFF